MSNINWAVSQALGGKPIDSELYRLRAVHEEKLRGQRAALETRCAEAIALKGEFDTGFAASSDPSAEVSGLLASATTMLTDQQENLTRAKQEREAYRLRFGITRAPVETGRITSILFLLVVIFIESLINASFFQNAHMAASPFAALLTSLLISITNVTACACAGYFVGRYIHYGNNASDSDEPEFVRIRRRAKFLFWCFLTVMTFFHLTVGLIRSSESLDHIIHNWLNYQDLMRTPEAVFLMMTGACLSVLAYYKGKNSFDDPYPGYGLRHRAVKTPQHPLNEAAGNLTATSANANASVDPKANSSLATADTDAISQNQNSTGKTMLSPLEFDPDHYREYLDDYNLSEQQENELLETLWNIMSSFVAIGFGLDSVQLFSTLEYDDSQENAGTDSDNSINNKPTQQDQSIANTFSTEAQQEANHE